MLSCVICICICVYVYVGYSLNLWRSEENIGCPTLPFSDLSLERGSLNEPGDMFTAAKSNLCM